MSTWMHPTDLGKVMALTWYEAHNVMHRSNHADNCAKDLTLFKRFGTPFAQGEKPGIESETNIDGKNTLLNATNGLCLLYS